MLFDSHIHFFPDKLAGKVFPKLSLVAGSQYYRNETLADTLAENEKNGVTHALALHIATNPNQEKSVNDFAIACQSEKIINFGSVHPLSPNAIHEIYRLKENGIKGIKLHPDYQDFMVDDKTIFPIYELCEKLGLIIAFHAGKDPYSPNLIHNEPRMIKDVSRLFPGLRMIAAHMGGLEMFEEVKRDLAGTENVYFDTAFASSFLTPKQFEEMVNLHGVDKILFGTDSPWSTAEKEQELIEKTNLSKEDKEKIYYKNAFKLLTI